MGLCWRGGDGELGAQRGLRRSGGGRVGRRMGRWGEWRRVGRGGGGSGVGRGGGSQSRAFPFGKKHASEGIRVFSSIKITWICKFLKLHVKTALSFFCRISILTRAHSSTPGHIAHCLCAPLLRSPSFKNTHFFSQKDSK